MNTLANLISIPSEYSEAIFNDLSVLFTKVYIQQLIAHFRNTEGAIEIGTDIIILRPYHFNGSDNKEQDASLKENTFIKITRIGDYIKFTYSFYDTNTGETTEYSIIQGKVNIPEDIYPQILKLNSLLPQFTDENDPRRQPAALGIEPCDPTLVTDTIIKEAKRQLGLD